MSHAITAGSYLLGPNQMSHLLLSQLYEPAKKQPSLTRIAARVLQHFLRLGIK
jgi:hypothetical protein